MTSTLDGKNRNPIVANPGASNRNKNLEYLRQKHELDEQLEDEIDN